MEEIIPLTSVNNAQQLMLKKDTEKFNNVDMGKIILSKIGKLNLFFLKV